MYIQVPLDKEDLNNLEFELLGTFHLNFNWKGN